jgi:hypothetical protein
MAFWSNIFTLETWAQARDRAFTVGFRHPHPEKGGYSVGMFERVVERDILLCYCKSPAARWVGALQVVGPAFQSDEPVWGLTETGEARYPWRFPVKASLLFLPRKAFRAKRPPHNLSSFAGSRIGGRSFSAR